MALRLLLISESISLVIYKNMLLFLNSKPFSFQLIRPLKTSQGIIYKKTGFLIKLQNKAGGIGWGEVAANHIPELKKCEAILKSLGPTPSRAQLEETMRGSATAIGFGIGAALAELDCLVGNRSNQKWLTPLTSAYLLHDDESPITQIDSILKSHEPIKGNLTIKWKVGTKSNEVEEKMLNKILSHLPANARLRIDANGSWDRQQATCWGDHLKNESKLEWIEQPLHANDIVGLLELANKLPIALDESLVSNPILRKTWSSWQIRRPVLEGDPRPLLKELNENIGYRVISTSFETGIGRRWLNHLAALQQQGPTPTAPGLAPGWCSNDPIFSRNPQLVWEAA